MKRFFRFGAVSFFSNFNDHIFHFMTAHSLLKFGLHGCFLTSTYQYFYLIREQLLTRFLRVLSTHIWMVFRLSSIQMFTYHYIFGLHIWLGTGLRIEFFNPFILCIFTCDNQFNYFRTSKINSYDFLQVFLACLFRFHSHPPGSRFKFKIALSVPLHQHIPPGQEAVCNPERVWLGSNRQSWVWMVIRSKIAACAVHTSVIVYFTSLILLRPIFTRAVQRCSSPQTRFDL